MNRFIFQVPEEKTQVTAEETFTKIIQKMIDDAYENGKREGWEIQKLGIELFCEAIYDPVVIPMRPKEQNSADVVFNAFMKLQQSFREVDLLYQPISTIITTMSVPEGEGKPFCPHRFTTKELGKIQINNNNRKCLFYALEMTRRYILTTGKRN